MTRLTLFALAALFATLSSAAAEAKVVHIDIAKVSFQPARVTVSVGDTIEWTNHDVVAHTATAVNKSWEVVLPVGATSSLGIGSVGTISYYCRVHPNMKGVIDVLP